MAWSGKGYWVAICNLAGAGLAFGPAWLLGFPGDRAVAVFFALWGLFSAMGIYFAARAIERQPPRTLIDAETNERIVIPSSAGEFSFLPAKYWVPINFIGGLVIAALAFTGTWNVFNEVNYP